ncbi:MAG TPA: DUF4389 domain-containing protein [Actinomycetota bacterium]|nr:DUF4389 domain-containing protein [Actinomycetota bacterium]
MAQTGTYPVSFTVDYPDRELNRLTTAFRLILAIPILVVSAVLSNSVGVLFLPPLLLILFRQKYPRWWFDWNLMILRFLTRIETYTFLLRDEYPSTDEEQAVHLDIPYPDAKNELNRWLPLVKWLLAIPHIIVLAVLHLAVVVVTIIAWFAILFTGRYPRGLFDFVVGVYRWTLRVTAYAFMLTTDRYPPFSLQA